MEKRFLAEPLSGCQVPKVWCLSGGELWNERRAGTCGNHPLAGRSSFVISRPRCMEVAELDVGQAALGPGSGCISMVVCDSLLLAGKAGSFERPKGLLASGPKCPPRPGSLCRRRSVAKLAASHGPHQASRGRSPQLNMCCDTAVLFAKGGQAPC